MYDSEGVVPGRRHSMGDPSSENEGNYASVDSQVRRHSKTPSTVSTAPPKRSHSKSKRRFQTMPSYTNFADNTGLQGLFKAPPSKRASGRWMHSAHKLVVAQRFTNYLKHFDKSSMFADTLLVENAFEQLAIFALCSAELIADCAKQSSARRFHEGNILANEGHQGSSMIVVLEGQIDVLVHDEKVTALTQGDCIGETLLLDVDHFWNMSLVVSGTCMAAELSSAGFQKALDAHPSEKAAFAAVSAQNRDFKDHGTLIHKCVIFRGLSDDILIEIDKHLVRRLYFPGEHILVEGTKGDELYILVRGMARVEIANRLVRMERRGSNGLQEFFKDGLALAQRRRESLVREAKEVRESGGSEELICFGELGLLGMQETRSASVTADSICHMRVLYRHVFTKVLSARDESMQLSNLSSFLQERYKGQAAGHLAKPALELFQEAKTFREVGCSTEFLQFLSQHLEDRIFLRGQRIIDEFNADDRCMYLLLQGKAKVIKNGRDIAVINSGAIVGELTVLGLNSKRSATVMAEETCCMQVLHQNIVVRGLELFPEERSKVLMMAWKSQGQPVRSLHGLDSSKEHPEELAASFDKKSMARLLIRSPVLSNVSIEFIEELSVSAADRIYMPGDMIIEQGVKGDSMLIMVSGTAGVYVANVDKMENFEEGVATDGVEVKKIGQQSVSRVGTLSSGSVGGELAMLGVAQVRSASLQAETICSMWEVAQEDALPIINRHPDAKEYFAKVIVDHLERTVPQRILGMPLFGSFDRKFRTLLGIYCERAAYFPEQQIVREGQPGEKLYVVNLGRARLEKKGVQVKLYASGSHFGSTVMLGVHKSYIGTLIALQTCHMLAVTKTTYLAALEKYPAPVAAQVMRRSETTVGEMLKEAVVRTATRKLIMARARTFMNPAATGNPLLPGAPHLTDPEILERFVHAWSQRVKYCRSRRHQIQREDEQRKEMMQGFIQKRAEAIRRAEAKRQMHSQGLTDRDSKDDAATIRHVDETKPLKLPLISSTARNKEHMADVLREWPSPRPSPHYQLRVYSVLKKADSSPSEAAALLPLLQQSIKDRREKGRPESVLNCLSPISGDSDAHHTSESDADVQKLGLARNHVHGHECDLFLRQLR